MILGEADEGGSGRLYRFAVLSEVNVHTLQPDFKIPGMAGILNIRLPTMDLYTKMGCKVRVNLLFDHFYQGKKLRWIGRPGHVETWGQPNLCDLAAQRREGPL